MNTIMVMIRRTTGDSGAMTARLRHLKSNADRWGWPRALFNVLVEGSARYLGIHIHVVRIRKFPSIPSYPETNAALTFRIIEKVELRQYCNDPEIQLDPAFVESAISRGDRAFGAFDGPTLVSYVWRSVESAPDVGGIWIRVNKPYNYAYKSFTRPDYRGQRISPVLHLFSDDEMRKLGYEYRCGFVAISNYSSLEMGKHMGSVRIGHAGYFNVFGRLVTFRTRRVRAIGFEFFRPADSRQKS